MPCCALKSLNGDWEKIVIIVVNLLPVMDWVANLANSGAKAARLPVDKPVTTVIP
ncbi:hypothetical protein KDK_63720 [Dictyobacter kobayashii]|uniref:Uncharacterized protein n=1 Tax=Dictyobacter kobayashii TaxID=2014872 RepID=A0A402AJ26_9CHLR|nr:hypothetical protein KDK_05050 [Dictyobacter kobayashii]GCE19099.1 hypothetical protein KDK_28990 [Dictyobacter kobayashii]GCE20692.1 hypothetical protein KDK_44920 [Dictyobacter kobayashii]GCE21081.1 hypothetical protein KDK_48810 [Dictyobacter kobayashii]GCE22572.1 hypothetical protein KDK_63720 [Dictyobacter kobayashii]